MLLIENSTIYSTFDIPIDEQIKAFIQISNPQKTVRFYNFMDRLFLFKLWINLLPNIWNFKSNLFYVLRSKVDYLINLDIDFKAKWLITVKA